MKRNFNIGIIGAGLVGERLINAIIRHPSGSIQGIYDVNTERLEEIAEQYHISPVRSYHDLLEDPEVDVIYLAVPPKYHYAIASDIIQAGKHFLCEKPLANSEEKARQLYEGALKSDLVNAMYFPTVYTYNHVATRHTQEAINKLKMIPVGMGKEVLPKELLTKSIYSGTWSRMIAGEQSVTITTRFDTPSSGRFTHPILNRCITVREAARIQPFPDDFIFYGKKSSQMKQVGNAVPPLLGKSIAEAILNQIK